MAAEKLSISLEPELAAAVRAAAAEQGVTVSAWLGEAAAARMRQYYLGQALDSFAAEVGALEDDEIDGLVEQARRDGRVAGPGWGAA